MTDPDWISFSEVVERIVDRDVKRLGEFRSEQYIQTWRALSENLQSGKLTARPGSRDDYSYSFTSAFKSEVIPLDADGAIPATFWFHYDQALAIRPALVTLPDVTGASSDWDNFHFLLTDGLVEDGRLEGWARRVTVNRDGLGNLLPRRGARRGTRRSERVHIVDLADRSIRTGKMTPSEAVAHFSLRIHDPTTTDDSIKAWLRRELKKRGHRFGRRSSTDTD